MTNRKRLMTIAIMTLSLSTAGLFFMTQTDTQTNANLFSWNSISEDNIVKTIEDATFEINGKNGINHFIAPLGSMVHYAEASKIAETMFLTDEPGNWFSSETGGLVDIVAGTPLTVLPEGSTVKFEFGKRSDATHTVTLLMKPENSQLEVFMPPVDMDKADDDNVQITFDKTGTYLFACKVHPYMNGIVAVVDSETEPGLGAIAAIPPIVGADTVSDNDTILPALGPDGSLSAFPALPASAVLSALTTIAPLDGDTNGEQGPVGDLFGKANKWDIVDDSGAQLASDANVIFPDLSKPVSVPKDSFTLGNPSTPGVGEVWINSQFERVLNQHTGSDGLKPGTITVLDAADLDGDFKLRISANGAEDSETGTLSVQGKGDRDAEKMWNNPHNMWTDVTNDVVYNGNWFGQWLNRIDRDSGDIETSLTVGPAPTHIVTMQGALDSENFGKLTIPLSGGDEILRIVDEGPGRDLKIDDHFETGFGNNHPHGQWIAADGKTAIIPNVFQGLGLAGSVARVDMSDGTILSEVSGDSAAAVEFGLHAFDANLALPVAAGSGVTPNGERAYISNIGTGTVSVIDMTDGSVIKSIPVALSETTGTATGVLSSLRLPIQTPVSPDGKFVVTAIFSLASQLVPDKIQVINTSVNEVVATLDCPAGCHGVNWGAKSSNDGDTSQFYAYVTSQHANILTIVDPDPGVDTNGNGIFETDGSDATIVSQVRVGTPTDGELQDNPTIGTGGQGIKPIPNVSDGWIQNTVDACSDQNEEYECSDDVNTWLGELTNEQKQQ